MLSQREFFEKYGISHYKFRKTGLVWSELQLIYNDFSMWRKDLDVPARLAADIIRPGPRVHAVKWRVKDAEHLVEKIIRRTIRDGSIYATSTNYSTKVEDLAGVRALHLFKEDWVAIHRFIHKKWDVLGNPEANVLEQDPPELLSHYEAEGCELKPSEKGYRSIHYIVEVQCDKSTKHVVELQVRTLFEEAWSEISHEMAYPYYQDNQVIEEFTKLSSRLSGQADQISSYANLWRQYQDKLADFQRKLVKKKEVIESEAKLDRQYEVIAAMSDSPATLLTKSLGVTAKTLPGLLKKKGK